MATSTPARLLGLAHEVGTLKIGARADLAHLSDALELLAVY
jgi:N-acetylglucosamine-6-phosphate deacetylase